LHLKNEWKLEDDPGFLFFESHVSQGRLLLVLGSEAGTTKKNTPFFLGGEIRKKNLLQKNREIQYLTTKHQKKRRKNASTRKSAE